MPTERPNGIAAQMGRYLLVAVVAAATDTATLWALDRLLGVHYTLAAAAGFIVGLIVNFGLARSLVFGPTRLPVAGEFSAYAVIGVVGLGLTELVLWVTHGLAGMDLLAGKAFALGIVFFWNFFARRQLVYGRADTEGAGA
ncbi:MAG: GtrA family protein [Coriobacteriia bacterium]